jgi:hypothetical protein
VKATIIQEKMKKLALTTLITTLNFFLTIAQEHDKLGAFKFDHTERTVTWIKVFEVQEDVTSKKLMDYFKENNIIDIKEVNEDSFSGQFFKRTIDLQKYGFSRGSTPMVLIDMEQVFNVKIDFKEGRYRATLTDLGYVDNGIISDLTQRSLLGVTATTAKGNIESYNGDFSFTNKNEVRTRVSSVFEILDVFYSDILRFKEKDTPNDDW